LLGTSQAAEILLPNSSRFALESTYRINPRFPRIQSMRGRKNNILITYLLTNIVGCSVKK
jgi:hypothetical protein